MMAAQQIYSCNLLVPTSLAYFQPYRPSLTKPNLQNSSSIIHSSFPSLLAMESLDVESQFPPELNHAEFPDQPVDNKTGPGYGPGYLQLANGIEYNTELAVFRRFGDLNILNILCLQAELVQLRSQLISLPQSPVPQNTLLRNIVNLAEFVEADGEPPSAEVTLMKKIRKKLKEYSEQDTPAPLLTCCF